MQLGTLARVRSTLLTRYFLRLSWFTSLCLVFLRIFTTRGLHYSFFLCENRIRQCSPTLRSALMHASAAGLVCMSDASTSSCFLFAQPEITHCLFARCPNRFFPGFWLLIFSSSRLLLLTSAVVLLRTHVLWPFNGHPACHPFHCLSGPSCLPFL